MSEFVSGWQHSPFSGQSLMPWDVTFQAPELISKAIRDLGDEYAISDNIAIHETATVETNATLKGPVIIGKNSYVANGAYLRGGVFLDENCIVGPSCELKTTLMFKGSKVAHLSFVGDSIIGCRANIEAGAMVANYRNEKDDKSIRFMFRGEEIHTGRDKFGALISDDVRLV